LQRLKKSALEEEKDALIDRLQLLENKLNVMKVKKFAADMQISELDIAKVGIASRVLDLETKCKAKGKEHPRLLPSSRQKQRRPRSDGKHQRIFRNREL
jgi:hypothetical protein